MTTLLTLMTGPWRSRPLWAALALGVCLFWGGFAPFPAHAVGDDSALFHPGAESVKNPSTAKDNPTDGGDALPLPDEKPQQAPGFWGTLGKLVLALALTLALIYATVWALKLVWDKKGWDSTEGGDRPIKVLASTHLAPRKSVYLVEVGKRILVVGAGHEELTALDVISDPEEVEVLRQSAKNVGGFPEVLRKVWRRNEAEDVQEETRRLAEEGRETIGGFAEKWKHLSPKSKAGPKTGGGQE